jgi:cell wall-associated NlpC family hydrolase
VFASYTAGAQTGVDVARLTPDRVSRLRSVFWMMCNITSSTETVTTPDSDPYDHVDNSRTETTLTITITGKTAEEMRTVYRFTPFQNETLDLLLSDTAMLNSLIGNMDITQQDALELLRSLPADLSPERRAVVEHALSLVGKVNYFWGGKSRVIGWDSRWGQLREVTSAGSPTTGTYRPFGLDCSGFADWVFYNASGGEYILGHGGGAASQHGYCRQISWGEAQPGDLVFYPDDSHVGIVGLRDETGNLLIIHCASGQNNVVITDSSGFMTAGRPLYYGE